MPETQGFTFRRALLQVAQNQDIDRFEMMQLRVVTLIPGVCDRLEAAAREQAVFENVVQDGAAIDWSGLTEFLKVILPFILQLIKKQ